MFTLYRKFFISLTYWLLTTLRMGCTDIIELNISPFCLFKDILHVNKQWMKIRTSKIIMRNFVFQFHIQQFASIRQIMTLHHSNIPPTWRQQLCRQNTSLSPRECGRCYCRWMMSLNACWLQYHTGRIWCWPVLPWSVARRNRQIVQLWWPRSLDNCGCNSRGDGLHWPCRWIFVHWL